MKIVEKFEVIPGAVYEVAQGPNPHRNGARETITVTIIGKDRHGFGFYYFQGNGKPDPDWHQERSHSNMFVWGVESVKKIGQVKFAIKSFEKFQWTITGIAEVDAAMAQVDERYSVFNTFAPTWAKNRYLKQEDMNYHSENGKMVDRFTDWVSAGNKAEEFPKSTRSKKS